MKNFFGYVLFAITITTILLGETVYAYDKQQLLAALQSRVDNGIGVGMVVGIIDGEKEELFTVGYGDKENNSPLKNDSLMNIGSLSKTFTGILLADMVLKGEVELDAPVEKYLPASVAIPSFKGQKITLRHLITHRSALPSQPSNKNPLDRYNLWANYSVSDLCEFLASHQLARRPGETAEYSNTGFALLGYSLAQVSGKSFETLLRERVLNPLGMYQTAISIKSAALNNTTGHNQLQRRVVNGELSAFAPAGGIKSTAKDMMRYMKANMGQLETPLAEVIKLSHQVLEHYSASHSVGFAWFISRKSGTPNFGHIGAISGYRASIRFNKVGDRAEKIGVFVITNSFDKAWNIATAIEQNDIASLFQKPVKTVKVAELVLNQYAGTYEFDDGEQFIITAQGGELFGQTPGQLKIRILPISKDEFVFTFVEGKVQFISDDKGKINHLILTQDRISKALKID